MNPFLSLALAVGLLLPPAAPSPVSPPPMPPDLDAYISSQFDEMHFPGMRVQIVSADEVLFSKGYGQCADADAPFIIGSQSKSFTAVAILQLAEAGKLSLDDAVSAHLPDVPSGVTLRDLLNQTSGVATFASHKNAVFSAPAPFNYANYNYGLLGLVVEAASGQSYESYVQQHIFDALGMRHSYTSLDAAKQDGLAPGHQDWFGVMVAQEVPYPNDNEDFLSIPAGYIISSAGDMGLYLQSLLQQGKGLMQPASAAAMVEQTVPAGPGRRYGLGLGLDQKGDEWLVVHGGNVENYTTYMVLLPQQGWAMEVMVNGADYMVANAMLVNTAYNIVSRVKGAPTRDIAPGAYWKGHILIDAMLVAVLCAGLLPLLGLGRWRRRLPLKKRPVVIACTALWHFLLPAVILVVLPLLLNIPAAILARFAPDIFTVGVVSAALLLAGGIAKTWRLVRTK